MADWLTVRLVMTRHVRELGLSDGREREICDAGGSETPRIVVNL